MRASIEQGASHYASVMVLLFYREVSRSPNHQINQMKTTRARTLALELQAFDLIDNGTVLQAQAIIAGLLFSNPELTDKQVMQRALEV